MRVVVAVEGEDDMRPFTKVFDYEKPDEFIFFDSVDMIRDKISKSLRLNINEALALFAAFVVSSLRGSDPDKNIRERSSRLLSPNQVMIGVPELLRRLTFSVTADDVTDRTVVMDSPIPTGAPVRHPH